MYAVSLTARLRVSASFTDLKLETTSDLVEYLTTPILTFVCFLNISSIIISVFDFIFGQYSLTQAAEFKTIITSTGQSTSGVGSTSLQQRHLQSAKSIPLTDRIDRTLCTVISWEE